MSKSKGNVVPPDELIARYGADTERLYTLFVGPPDRDAEWSDSAVEGTFRFLNRVWALVHEWPFDATDLGRPRALLGADDLPESVRALHRKTHQTIRKVTADMEGFHFNTAVAAVMELSNSLRSFIDSIEPGGASEAERAAIDEALSSIVVLLAPMVPHFCEEVWERMGGRRSIFRDAWPSYDEAAAREDTVTIAVQVNGKLRGEVEVERGADEETVLRLATAEARVGRHIEGKEIRRVVFVPGRLLNLVVR
jgi:leucyl-tRNA synthetase